MPVPAEEGGEGSAHALSAEKRKLESGSLIAQRAAWRAACSGSSAGIMARKERNWWVRRRCSRAKATRRARVTLMGFGGGGGWVRSSGSSFVSSWPSAAAAALLLAGGGGCGWSAS